MTTKTILLPLSTGPRGLALIADTLADADLNHGGLRTRERYYLIDGATLAERVGVTR